MSEKKKICKHRYAIVTDFNPNGTFYCMGIGATKTTCKGCALEGKFPREEK